MNPAILTVLLTYAPEVIAKIIAILQAHGAGTDADTLELILRRSDANADLLIKNAQAALTATPPAP